MVTYFAFKLITSKHIRDRHPDIRLIIHNRSLIWNKRISLPKPPFGDIWSKVVWGRYNLTSQHPFCTFIRSSATAFSLSPLDFSRSASNTEILMADHPCRIFQGMTVRLYLPNMNGLMFMIFMEVNIPVPRILWDLSIKHMNELTNNKKSHTIPHPSWGACNILEDEQLLVSLISKPSNWFKSNCSYRLISTPSFMVSTKSSLSMAENNMIMHIAHTHKHTHTHTRNQTAENQKILTVERTFLLYVPSFF